MHDVLRESLNYLSTRIGRPPSLAIILGSGLGTFAEHLKKVSIVDCREIPNYPVSTVEGHEGLLYFGKLDGVDVLALKGRVHCYEGYTMQQVSYPVQLMAGLGIRSLIVTNASGGVNENFTPGDLMLITDHINFTFDNPLIGQPVTNEEDRFLNTADAYYLPYRELALRVAEQCRIPLQQGVLFVSKGPCYETAAEIRMVKILGADAVTMSTVPEVILAHQKHMKILGISCITNLATGIAKQKLDHQEVTITANRIKDKFIKLVSEIIKEIDRRKML